MSQSGAPLTYYHATATPHPDHPALEGDIRVDACVVGAGFTGLTAAYELARRGFSVAVLEAESIGWGASGRNGGQICTGYSSGMGRIEAQVGLDDARKCFAIAEDAKAQIAANVAELDIPCDLKWGYLNVAPNRRAVDELREMQKSLARYGYEKTTLIGADELAQKLGTARYKGALRDNGAGHFHPLNYVRALAAATCDHGARIFENSRVIAIGEGSRPVVKTEGGTVCARFVVVAGNAYLGRTVKTLYYRIMPVGSYVVATEPLGENMARALIRDDEAVSDTNFVLDYFRLTGDRRMLFGGRCSYSGVIPDDVRPIMRSRMTRVFPQLKDARLDFGWGGYIAITANRIPDIGRLAPNVYYAHGFSGQGVTLGCISGRILAETIAGQAERFDLMARFRHRPFPGGPIRTPILMLAMLWYRLRDALG